MAVFNDPSFEPDELSTPMVEMGHGVSFRLLFDKTLLHVRLDSRVSGSRECIDTWINQWAKISKAPLHKTPVIALVDLRDFVYSQHVYQQMQTSARLSRNTRLRYSAVVMRSGIKGKLLKIAFQIMEQATNNQVENKIFLDFEEAMNWALEKYHALR